MTLFAAPSTRQLNTGLAILRAVAGVVFIAHGAQKLFVFGVDGVTAGFAGMGIPLAGIAAPLVALTEFGGGLALLVGLGTRPVAAALGAVMAGAMLFVHLPAGFFLPNGYEFVLTLLGIATLFALVGGGAYSVDALVARRGGEVADVPATRPVAGARRAA
jgi:putative oxidoreductase